MTQPVRLTGGAYQARSVVAAAQRCLNLYSEPMPEQEGEPAAYANYPTPGLILKAVLPENGIRGAKTATNGSLYVCAGSGIYVVASDWSITYLGSITAGLTAPVGMSDNGLQLVIVDGTSNGWAVTLAGNTFAPIVDSTGSFRGGDRVDYLDTFFLFNVPGTPQFQSSLSLGITFDALYFANKESYSDLLVTLVVAKREIWLLGSATTEVWYNSGAADFPFETMPGVFIDHGCAAKYSAVELDSGVYWVSQTRYGQGIVMQGSGYQATRISTFAMETELATYTTLSDAVGYAYQIGGHQFYVLNFPTADKTWVYDLSTKLWHELCWLDVNGTEHRHRGNCAANAYGVVVLGDWQNGNLYAADLDTFTDNHAPIKRVRSFPHLLQDGKRLVYREFIADMETGNAPSATQTIEVQGAPAAAVPQIAQLVVPADAFGLPQGAIVDWARSKVYLWNSTADVRVYTTALATQNPILSASLPAGTWWAGDVDPVSGDLIVQNGGYDNAEPILKINPATMAAIATFGGGGPFPSYPGSVWAGEALACVAVSGVGYAVLKEGATSGNFAVIRTDTMAQAGAYFSGASVGSGGHTLMCRGASGGTRGSVFVTADSQYTGQAPTLPLGTIVITAGAQNYNPASWPTPNPNITGAIVGDIAASAVNADCTALAANAIGYDRSDGNVLLGVNTTGGAGRYIIKVNAMTAAVMWAVPVANTGSVDLAHYNVANGYEAFLPTGQRDVITSGVVTSTPMAGIGASISIGDDVSGVMVLDTSYAAGGTAPVAVSGTPADFTGWAILDGVYPGPPTESIVVASGSGDGRVFLSWSDDRGHAFGNPVGEDLGAIGDYLKSLQFQRLGMGRDRVFQLEWSVNAKTVLQGAWIDAVPAKS